MEDFGFSFDFSSSFSTGYDYSTSLSSYSPSYDFSTSINSAQSYDFSSSFSSYTPSYDFGPSYLGSSSFDFGSTYSTPSYTTGFDYGFTPTYSPSYDFGYSYSDPFSNLGSTYSYDPFGYSSFDSFGYSYSDPFSNFGSSYSYDPFSFSTYDPYGFSYSDSFSSFETTSTYDPYSFSSYDYSYSDPFALSNDFSFSTDTNSYFDLPTTYDYFGFSNSDFGLDYSFDSSLYDYSLDTFSTTNYDDYFVSNYSDPYTFNDSFYLPTYNYSDFGYDSNFDYNLGWDFGYNSFIDYSFDDYSVPDYSVPTIEFPSQPIAPVSNFTDLGNIDVSFNTSFAGFDYTAPVDSSVTSLYSFANGVGLGGNSDFGWMTGAEYQRVLSEQSQTWSDYASDGSYQGIFNGYIEGGEYQSNGDYLLYASDGGNVGAPTGSAWQRFWANAPSLPDWLVNGAAGFGDGVSNALTFGLVSTSDVRNWLGIGSVNTDSTAYVAGDWAGTVWGALTGVAGGLNGGARTVLWSNGGLDLGAGSAKYAAMELGTTLEATPIGKMLQGMQNMGIPIPMKVWEATSAVFAMNAKGEVTVVLGAINSNTVLMRIELPILNARGIGFVIKP